MKLFLTLFLLLSCDLYSTFKPNTKTVMTKETSNSKETTLPNCKDKFDFTLEGEQFMDDLELFKYDLINFLTVINIVKKNFIGEVTYESLFKGALKGVMDSLDTPYSKYMNEKEYEYLHSSYIEDISKEGLGIVPFTPKGSKLRIVIKVVKNSSAERSGILPGDIIKVVNGKDVSKLNNDQFSNILSSSKNFSFLLDRNGKDISISLSKMVIEPNMVNYNLIEGNIGYIELEKFSLGIGSKVRDAFNDLKSKGANSIILDLRDNGGGALKDAVEVASIFLDGNIVQQCLKDRKILFESLGDSDITTPLVLLIDGGSASGSEIIAGAIKDNERGLLIGETTFGKGSFQVLFPVDITDKKNCGAIKLDVSTFITPKNHKVNKIGVDPHLTVGEDSSIYSFVNNFIPPKNGDSSDIFIKKLKNIYKHKKNQLKSAIIFIKALKGNFSQLFEKDK